MKHILRLVTYGALKPSKWEHGRPSRARMPVDDYQITVTPREPPPQFLHTQGTTDKKYRLVGIARYPDRVESRYERYL
jgi:hypothetical protein